MRVQEEGVELGALLGQINLGDNNAAKHRPGSVPYVAAECRRFFRCGRRHLPRRMEDFLPREYAQKRKIDRRLFAAHRKLGGMSELDAKHAFVEKTRALRTCMRPCAQSTPAALTALGCRRR